jgi:orotate phosphoribosyltransferase
MSAALDLQSALVRRGAILEGHFRLSSGRHSDRFVQKFRILEDPALLESVGRALAERFRTLKPTVVVGAAVGAILLAYEVARQLGTKAIFVEKENGVPKLRRGFALVPEDRVLLVEDVLTTGLSVSETIDVVRRHGAQIVGLGVIIARDRDILSPSPFDSAQDDTLGMNFIEGPTHVLLELPLRSYDQAECPQCRAGEPVTDPGSRRS